MTIIHAVNTRDTADVHRALSRLDLNLIVALDALLTTRNVTRAAERLSLSQPALSASLSRLRAHFDDPLLVRRGRTHDLSPLGERLRPMSGMALDRVYAIFQSTAGFDPAHATQEFIIHCSDYSSITVGTRVRALAAVQAPGITFRFVHQAAASLKPLPPSDLLELSDGVILPHGVLHGSPHIDLWMDTWVCIVAESNSAVGEELAVDDLGRLPWVTNYYSPSHAIPPMRHLNLLGIHPRVETVVEGFLSMPYFVAGSDRIAFVPETVADDMPRSLKVRKIMPPFPAVHHELAFWWHPAHDEDPAHAWLRSLFEQIQRTP